MIQKELRRFSPFAKVLLWKFARTGSAREGANRIRGLVE